MYSVCELETRKSSALPLQPWFPTSGGLTRVAGRKRPQLQLRYSHPRRAGVRRSCECAFLHRKNRFFAGRHSHCTKSGGRKPPVERIPHASSTRRNSPHCRCNRRFRPARSRRVSLDESVRNCNCVTHTHGGLTPAALVNVRSCIAKIAICSPTVHREPRAGGVSPPWFATATPPAFVSTPSAVSSDLAEAFLQVRFPNTHGGLTPVAGRTRPQLQLRYSRPRRADACRSCACAFVHRTNRFFADNRSHCTKSGGRKPPVGCSRYANPKRGNPGRCRCKRGFRPTAG
jgi:hypothetical protein